MKYHTLKDYLPIIKDKESGMTFQDIADKMGCARQRVQQIYARGKLLQRTKNTDPFWGLPSRALDAFSMLGLKDKDQVKRAVEKKKLHPEVGIPNYRWITHNKILAWLQLPEIPLVSRGSAAKAFHTCPKCKHQFSGA